MSVVDRIRDAGVVGAGGAGFPTHVKVGGKADIVLGNGAECEPLLCVDRQMMQNYPREIVRGLKAVMEATGAKEGVICLKKKYKEAIQALEEAINDESHIRLFPLDNFYPAGDEQTMVWEVTGKVVPTGGIPLDVGAVVANVSTLINIAEALDNKPVTDKYVTVAGEVQRPLTIKVPIGTPFSKLIAAAFGPETMEGYTIVVGGPTTGKLCHDWSEPVQKTTGGVLIFKSSHPLIKKKTENGELDLKLAKAVCCQCSFCTQLCPRNSLGLDVKPHKVMRAAFMGNGSLIGDPNGVFSCCDCGLCSYYACNFGLNPNRMMTRMKEGLVKSGVKPDKRVAGSVSPGISTVRVPTNRLMTRMGISRFDRQAPLTDCDLAVDRVRLPLKMHIGAPSMPVVRAGDTVVKGQMIAAIPEKGLGAKIHASINGVVTEVAETYIEISAAG